MKVQTIEKVIMTVAAFATITSGVIACVEVFAQTDNTSQLLAQVEPCVVSR